MARVLDSGDQHGTGSDGPVPVLRYPRERWAAVARAFEQARLERGFPCCEDFNAEGATGVWPVPHNLIDGSRWLTAREGAVAVETAAVD